MVSSVQCKFPIKLNFTADTFKWQSIRMAVTFSVAFVSTSGGWTKQKSIHKICNWNYSIVFSAVHKFSTICMLLNAWKWWHFHFTLYSMNSEARHIRILINNSNIYDFTQLFRFLIFCWTNGMILIENTAKCERCGLA